MISERIVEYLVHNRVNTTEVADVLGKTGAIKGIHAVNFGHYKAGIVRYVYAYDESNWSVHEQIQDIEEDRIIFVDSFDCNERAIFGELVSKYLLLYRQSRAIIVNGNIRDAAEIHRENYPIWCKGFTPVGCFNKEPKNKMEEKKYRDKLESLDGSIAVCDDCGVVIIPKVDISGLMLEKLKGIENQEDIWFDRLNHFKESTFDIVCKKNYLDDKDYMDIRKIIEKGRDK